MGSITRRSFNRTLEPTYCAWAPLHDVVLIVLWRQLTRTGSITPRRCNRTLEAKYTNVLHSVLVVLWRQLSRMSSITPRSFNRTLEAMWAIVLHYTPFSFNRTVEATTYAHGRHYSGEATGF